jgi:DNA-binding NarL/FixJ family response regulator
MNETLDPLDNLVEDRSNPALAALIVSNSHPIQDGLKALLMVLRQIKGIRVAQTGQEAIDLTNACKPALVLFDTELPDEDIWQTLRQVRELCPNAMIVVMIDRIDQREPALKASANSVQMKGFSAADLFMTLEELLAQHHANC